MSFDEKLAELQKIVAQLESGKLSLEESLAVYEKGVTLTREASALLSEAADRMSVQVLKQDSSPGELGKR